MNINYTGNVNDNNFTNNNYSFHMLVSKRNFRKTNHTINYK